MGYIRYFSALMKLNKVINFEVIIAVAIPLFKLTHPSLHLLVIFIHSKLLIASAILVL